MSPTLDVVALAQRLVSIDTVNPPGNEDGCVEVLRPLLERAGFRVSGHAHAPGRTSLVARAGAQGASRSLCFVGHLDTVPLGKLAWSRPPFGAEIVDGRLYGRGACDMKSGVAAFVCAALERAAHLPRGTELVLILAAGEETGCEGSRHLASLGLPLDGFSGVIVAEPTDNFPMVGHKGALWLQAAVQGVSAHGSMPDAGVNAIHKGMEIVGRLRHFCSRCAAHPVLGRPTLNVGTFHAGQNVNSVPDWAEIGVDIRTVPGMDHDATRGELAALLAPELHALAVLTDMPPVYTPIDDPWVRRVFAIVERETGRPAEQRTASYFTDASALKPALAGAPTLILGPGQPALMHQVDEYCEVDAIRRAQRIYRSIIDDTLGAADPARDAAASTLAA